MKHENGFLILAADTRKKMVSLGAASKTSTDRFDKCIQLLASYLKSKMQDFSLEAGLKWLDTIEHSPSKTHDSSYTVWSSYRRIVYLLADNQCGRLDEWRMYKFYDIPVPSTGAYSSLLSEYRQSLHLEAYAPRTIKKKMQIVQKFLVYLETQDAVPFPKVTNENVASYFLTEHFKNRKPGGVRAEACDIKLFLEYVEESGISSCSLLHNAVPVVYVPENRIITTINKQVENSLLEAPPSCTADKRERAAYLLALRLGLRSCDIYDLRFRDIDWDTGILNIIQKKTKTEIKMQMDAETQNALIDYILHERRELESEYIFVTAFGHIARKTGNCRSLHSRMDADLQEKLPHDGLHILRRTFASRLLNKGVALPVISAALGHTGRETLKPYLSTDEEKMRRCAIGLCGIQCGREEF
ncbi:MAG: tyrosine-type recombinase/integrase [Lachnospiraceae bacterium]|nr:tyrosine-type recombinase/integrase [Lachnospiraceae bacterium]